VLAPRARPVPGRLVRLRGPGGHRRLCPARLPPPGVAAHGSSRCSRVFTVFFVSDGVRERRAPPAARGRQAKSGGRAARVGTAPRGNAIYYTELFLLVI